MILLLLTVHVGHAPGDQPVAPARAAHHVAQRHVHVRGLRVGAAAERHLGPPEDVQRPRERGGAPAGVVRRRAALVRRQVGGAEGEPLATEQPRGACSSRASAELQIEARGPQYRRNLR